MLRERLLSLRDIAKVTGSCVAKQAYSAARKTYRFELRQAKLNKNASFINKAVNKCSAAWKIIRSETSNVKVSTIPVTPNQFNDYFLGVADEALKNVEATPLSPVDMVLKTKSPTRTFEWMTITEEEVLRTVGRMKNSKNEVLLVAKRHIGFPTSVKLTAQDTKGPSKEEIVAATAHLNKQNSILVVPSFDCQESFQSEIRKVLYSLVEASAKILAQSPDAKVVFDGIAARINAKNKKEIDKNAVKYLKDLGFTEVQAKYALRLKRNRQIEAMEWLLENSHRVKDEPQEKVEEASASTLDTSFTVTGDNPLHTINKLLRDIQDFHYRHFEPSPKALETLQNMGFSQDDVVEALRVTGNNQVSACEWLCGERDPAVTQPDAGLDPEGQLYKALMNNPAIQLGLHNPKIMLAFLSILENPTSANLWLNDVDTAPVLGQVFKTYHSEKHIMVVNQQMELIKRQQGPS